MDVDIVVVAGVTIRVDTIRPTGSIRVRVRRFFSPVGTHDIDVADVDVFIRVDTISATDPIRVRRS